MPTPTEAYSYAMFLVELFPADAVSILSGSQSGDITALVEQRMIYNCAKFVGHSTNQIKGMAESQEWERLRALLPPPSHGPMTPRGFDSMNNGQIMPPTPSSSASVSLHPRRQPRNDLITVLHMYGTSPMIASPSGTTEYMIGDDKLERLPGVKVQTIANPQSIAVGGNWIQVENKVALTWNRLGDSITYWAHFWVVKPEHIRLGDVLLGEKTRLPRSGRDEGPQHSPFALEPQDSRDRRPAVPPAVPTAPPAVHDDFYQRESSSAIYSGGPPQNYGRPATQNDFGQTFQHATRMTVRADSSASGAHTFHTANPAMGASYMEDHSSRSESSSSSITARQARLGTTVMIQLSFGGRGNKVMPMDLTKTGDAIIAWLDPKVTRMSGRSFDRANYELKVTPSHRGDEDAMTTDLSEDCFDDSWETVKEFVQENRGDPKSRKAEFQLDIACLND